MSDLIQQAQESNDPRNNVPEYQAPPRRTGAAIQSSAPEPADTAQQPPSADLPAPTTPDEQKLQDELDTQSKRALEGRVNALEQAPESFMADSSSPVLQGASRALQGPASNAPAPTGENPFDAINKQTAQQQQSEAQELQGQFVNAPSYQLQYDYQPPFMQQWQEQNNLIENVFSKQNWAQQQLVGNSASRPTSEQQVDEAIRRGAPIPPTSDAPIGKALGGGTEGQVTAGTGWGSWWNQVKGVGNIVKEAFQLTSPLGYVVDALHGESPGARFEREKRELGQAGLGFLGSIAPTAETTRDSNGAVISDYKFDPGQGYFGELGTGIGGAALYTLNAIQGIVQASIYSIGDAGLAVNAAVTGNDPAGVLSKPEYQVPFYRYRQALSGVDLGFTNDNGLGGTTNKYLGTINPEAEGPQWWGGLGLGLALDLATGGVDDLVWDGGRRVFGKLAGKGTEEGLSQLDVLSRSAQNFGVLRAKDPDWYNKLVEESRRATTPQNVPSHASPTPHGEFTASQRPPSQADIDEVTSDLWAQPQAPEPYRAIPLPAEEKPLLLGPVRQPQEVLPTPKPRAPQGGNTTLSLPEPVNTNIIRVNNNILKIEPQVPTQPQIAVVTDPTPQITFRHIGEYEPKPQYFRPSDVAIEPPGKLAPIPDQPNQWQLYRSERMDARLDGLQDGSYNLSYYVDGVERPHGASVPVKDFRQFRDSFRALVDELPKGTIIRAGASGDTPSELAAKSRFYQRFGGFTAVLGTDPSTVGSLEFVVGRENVPGGKNTSQLVGDAPASQQTIDVPYKVVREELPAGRRGGDIVKAEPSGALATATKLEAPVEPTANRNVLIPVKDSSVPFQRRLEQIAQKRQEVELPRVETPQVPEAPVVPLQAHTQVLSRLSQELDGGDDMYVPIFEWRKQYPELSREEQDALLFKLQKEDAIELSSLQEADMYTSKQIDAGIPQVVGGPLFYIAKGENFDDINIQPGDVVKVDDHATEAYLMPEGTELEKLGLESPEEFKLAAQHSPVSDEVLDGVIPDLDAISDDAQHTNVLRDLAQNAGESEEDFYIPLYKWRNKYKNLSREEQDALLFDMQRRDIVDLSSLQEADEYTAAQIDNGIPQNVGGPLFFIAPGEKFNDVPNIQKVSIVEDELELDPGLNASYQVDPISQTPNTDQYERLLVHWEGEPRFAVRGPLADPNGTLEYIQPEQIEAFGIDIVTSSGSNEIRGRLDKVDEFLATNKEFHAPEVVLGADGQLRFKDGRHRTAVMMRYYQERGIPMVVSRETPASVTETTQDGINRLKRSPSPRARKMAEQLQQLQDNQAADIQNAAGIFATAQRATDVANFAADQLDEATANLDVLTKEETRELLVRDAVDKGAQLLSPDGVMTTTTSEMREQERLIKRLERRESLLLDQRDKVKDRRKRLELDKERNEVSRNLAEARDTLKFLQEEVDLNAAEAFEEAAPVITPSDLRPGMSVTEYLHATAQSVQGKDVTVVRRSNAKLTKLAQFLTGSDGKPIINPARKSPLKTSEVHKLQEMYGDLFAYNGKEIPDDILHPQARIEVQPEIPNTQPQKTQFMEKAAPQEPELKVYHDPSAVDPRLADAAFTPDSIKGKEQAAQVRREGMKRFSEAQKQLVKAQMKGDPEAIMAASRNLDNVIQELEEVPELAAEVFNRTAPKELQAKTTKAKAKVTKLQESQAKVTEHGTALQELDVKVDELAQQMKVDSERLNAIGHRARGITADEQVTRSMMGEPDQRTIQAQPKTDRPSLGTEAKSRDALEEGAKNTNTPKSLGWKNKLHGTGLITGNTSKLAKDMNQRTWYHGTRFAIDDLRNVSPNVGASSNADLGAGLYLTADPMMGVEYARAAVPTNQSNVVHRALAESGQLHEAVVNLDHVIDANTPINDRIRNTVRDVLNLNSVGEAEAIDLRVIKKIHRQLKDKPIGQLWMTVRKALTDDGYPVSEIQWQKFQADMAKFFKSEGIDGIYRKSEYLGEDLLIFDDNTFLPVRTTSITEGIGDGTAMDARLARHHIDTLMHAEYKNEVTEAAELQARLAVEGESLQNILKLYNDELQQGTDAVKATYQYQRELQEEVLRATREAQDKQLQKSDAGTKAQMKKYIEKAQLDNDSPCL